MTRKYNLIPDIPDDRDFIFKSANKALPEIVDLRPLMSSIVNQGGLGSCVANAIASGLREHMMINAGEPVTPMSRLYLYYKTREIMGTINQDSGVAIRDAFKVLNQQGCAPETTHPYIESAFTQKPSQTAEISAGAYKVAEYHRMMQVADMKEALANGQPVVMGMRIYKSFESQEVARTGIVPFPNTDTEQYLGGHAMLVVGYVPAEDGVRFIVRNSWGAGWGDKGYCYLPQKCFETNVVTDMWCSQLKLPVKPEELSFQQAINHFVSVGAFNDSVFWAKFEADFKAGKLTTSQISNVFLGFRKLAARDMNL